MGSLSGGCWSTAGESATVDCALTYLRIESVTSVTGVCGVQLTDGLERAAATGSVTWTAASPAPPVTSMPAAMTIEFAVTPSSPQYGFGSLEVSRTSYPGYPDTTSFSHWFSLTGAFAAGEQVEPAILYCYATGYSDRLILTSWSGAARVDCIGTGITGRSVSKVCDLPFTLTLPVALSMGGQCIVTVNGASTSVFETHEYALMLNPRWTQPLDSFYQTVATHLAVAP